MLVFGLFGRIWARIGPKGDKALRMGQGGTDGRTYVRTDGRTDGQIPPVFYRTSSPSGPLPKKLYDPSSSVPRVWQNGVDQILLGLIAVGL